MLETHLRSPVTCERLRASAVAEHIDAFADWLHSAGYTALTVKGLLQSLAGWTEWMRTAGYTAQDLLAGLDACKAMLAHEARVPFRRGPNRNSLEAASAFVRFLRERGVLALPVPAPSATERWPLLGEFRSWMRTNRGLTETSLDVYEGILVGLLAALGDDPGAYRAESLRTFVLERAKPHGIERAKSIAVAVRSFLRFLGATGRCAPGMDYAIPGYACWQQSAVPRYLAVGGHRADHWILCRRCQWPARPSRAPAVGTARPARQRGRRTQARRYRLAQREHPGVREGAATSVAAITAGRRRRHSVLLAAGSAAVIGAEVFVTVTAPLRPLTRAAVTHIVRSALRRCAIHAPINGAHVLRHSAATAMLRQGASLAGVGAVLRHRSARTTALYAKVDFDLLSEIAQPWPEVPPC